MPPSRFAALSPWRNLTAKQLQPSYSELPVGSNDASRSIAATSERLYLKGTSPSTLLTLDATQAGRKKYGSRAESTTLPTSAIYDIEPSPFDDGRIAIGGEDGAVIIIILQTTSQSPEVVDTWKHDASTGGPVLVRWNPHSADLLLSASPSSPIVALWNTAHPSQPALTIRPQVGSKAGGRFILDAAWTRDGTKIILALADGTVQSFDPRNDSSGQAISSGPPPFGLPKPIRISTTGGYVTASSLNASRQRELRIYTVESLTSPVQTITLDTASHPLNIVTDYDRSLLFLASRGDVSIRWIELDRAKKFPQGAFPLPPRTSFAGFTLLPAFGLDVIKAEINRLYVASTSGEVVAFSIEIPQRQTIDYHAHLFPDTAGGEAALTAEEWLAGQDKQVERVSLEPGKRRERGVQRQAVATEQATDVKPASQANGSASVEHKPQGVSSVAPTPVPSASIQETPEPSSVAEQPAEPITKSTRQDLLPPARVASSPTAEPSKTPAQDASKAQAAPRAAIAKTYGTPSTAAWSRTTLGGIAPLLPTYSSVPAFDTSVAPVARSFLATPTHLVYPLAGPGGRLAFHEIVREGRLPEAKDVSWIETGGKISDFEADPFNWSRVATVGGEEEVKLWRLPKAASLQPGGADSKAEGEYQQSILGQPEARVSVSSTVGRAGRIAFHPTASDVALVAGQDGLAVVDLQASQDAFFLSAPTAGEAEWSPLGSLVAFARADRKLVVWSPRQGECQAEIAAHESLRPFKIAWLDEDHLVTVGHASGSTRQAKLFKVTRSDGSDQSLQLKEEGRLSLDTSPAILFPHYDADAQLLYLWSKGERSITPLHISLNAPKPKFGSAPPLFKLLPAFQHGTPQVGLSFLPKRYCNVGDVEVDVTYRLSRTNEIHRVSWRVERKRKEFFQDDVFPATRDVEQPLFTAQEWIQGSSSSSFDAAKVLYLDLQPAGMTPLSQAPAAEVRSSDLGKGPTKRMLSAKEKEEELMSNVFSKAKEGGEEDEVEDTAARRRAPTNDDDWGDD